MAVTALKRNIPTVAEAIEKFVSVHQHRRGVREHISVLVGPRTGRVTGRKGGWADAGPVQPRRPALRPGHGPGVRRLVPRAPPRGTRGFHAQTRPLVPAATPALRDRERLGRRGGPGQPPARVPEPAPARLASPRAGVGARR